MGKLKDEQLIFLEDQLPESQDILECPENGAGQLSNKPEALVAASPAADERPLESLPATPAFNTGEGNGYRGGTACTTPVKRTAVYFMKVEDYIAISGKGKSTVYLWIRQRKLSKAEIMGATYVWITDKEDEYERITKRMTNTEPGFVSVIEWTCTGLARPENG